MTGSHGMPALLPTEMVLTLPWLIRKARHRNGVARSGLIGPLA